MTRADFISLIKRNVPSLILWRLVIGHGVFNLLLNTVPEHGNTTISLWIIDFLDGAYLVEPVLFGNWAGLGTGSLATRLPSNVVAMLIVLSTGTIKRWNLLLEDHVSQIWIEPFLMQIWQFVFAAAIGFAISKTAKRSFAHSFAARRKEPNNNQFSFKYLLSVTAACALLFTFIHISTGEAPLFAPRGVVGLVRGAFLAGIQLMFLLPIVAILLLLMTKRIRMLPLFATLVFGVLMSWLAIAFAAMIDSDRTESVLVPFLSTQFGALCAGLVTILPLRLVGCRIVREPDGKANGSESPLERVS